MDDLAVNESVVIPAGELSWRFGPSGGPGGQHANKASTRAELIFAIAGSEAFSQSMHRRVVGALGRRIVNGELVIVVDESRSQWRNRQLARQRLAEDLRDAMRPPPPPRRPTKPSRRARARRLDEKKRRGDVKRSRRRPDIE